MEGIAWSVKIGFSFAMGFPKIGVPFLGGSLKKVPLYFGVYIGVPLCLETTSIPRSNQLDQLLYLKAKASFSLEETIRTTTPWKGCS